MKRFTTFKLENIICNNYQTVANSIDTSDSILSQDIINIPFITDNFIAIPVQTIKQIRLPKEAHAKKILGQITKSDYELISFKKKQLDDKLFFRFNYWKHIVLNLINFQL